MDEREPPHYKVEHVRAALAEDPRVMELGIDVKIRGEMVFLSGAVSSQARHDAVGDVVAEILPGYEIHNDTSITAGSSGAPEEAEHLS